VPIIQIDKVPDNLDVVVATYWTTAYTLENIPAVQKYYFVQSDESKFFESNSKESIAARETYLKDYKFITMAKWLKEWLKLEYGKESVYIPNGVDFSIMNSVVPLVEKKGRLRVLLEGPIDAPFKCMKEAFEVVKDLDCEVWCISTAGKPDPSWRCDRFFDSVPMDKMTHIYSSCDVLLKMSSVESFCLPALEMMACGGTVVLNRFKGLEEFVVDGHNGLVVDLGDIEGAKRAMNMLIENPELREELSANARETAEQWGWERSFDLLEEMYYPSLFEKKEPVI
jgi:glycosyltransferase involved in cell wall biosynthesis